MEHLCASKDNDIVSTKVSDAVVIDIYILKPY